MKRSEGGLLVHKALREHGGIKLLWSDSRILTAQLLVVIAFVFGGGGSGAGLANLVVQLAALAALSLNARAALSFFKRAPRGLVVLVVVTLLIPMLQCVPLPPSIWRQLPGRDLAVQSLALIGKEQSWMPFSLNAPRTFIAFLSLLPPFAILVLTFRAKNSDRRALLAVLVICGIFEVLVGTQQLALGNQEFMFYAQATGTQDLQGTFANRNTAGLFIDIVLCALIGVLWRPRPRVLPVAIGAVLALFLGLGLFLTRSRSSMALAIIPLSMLTIYMWSFRGAFINPRWRSLTLIGALLGLAAVLGILVGNARIQNSLSRFDTLEDARPAIWRDTQSSIARFWPLGSGIGTFDEVFQVDESLEGLSPGRAARAHNEYLETTLESGILGVTVIICWGALIAILGWRGIHGEIDRGPQVAALASFMLLALQSILDYPLRSQALLCVAALMLGLMLRGKERKG